MSPLLLRLLGRRRKVPPEETRQRPDPSGPRTFAVGDIHGEVTLLRKLIEELAPREGDRLIFLGDYIDRGEGSRAVIDYLLELKQRLECVFLKGNHEDMLLDYLEGGPRYGQLVWLLNGGTATLESYGAEGAEELRRRMPPEHLEFLRSLRERFEEEGYIFVHAGLAAEEEAGDRHPGHLWVRESFIYTRQESGRKVIFGHTPQRVPLLMPDKIGLDTGAFYTGVLTALELPGEIIHQVRR